MRPHICLCVLHLSGAAKFTPSSLKAFIDAQVVFAKSCVVSIKSWSSETLIISMLVRQTTIHDTIGRRREACAIGTHDMAHVVLESPSCDSAGRGDLQPLVIDALPPEEVVMIPLKVDEDAKFPQEIRAPRPASEVIAAALANESRDGAATGARKYASMLVELPRVPVLVDAAVRFCIQALN